MKKILIFPVLSILFIITSCKRKESLQSYLIDTQEDSNFMRLDFSTSMLGSFLENTTEEDQNTFQTIEKLNLAFLPMNKATEEEFNTETKKIKGILKDSEYKSLFRVNDKRGKATIYYSGNPEKIDEFVAVVYAKEFGFGVARVLGDEMNPVKIMQMIQNLKKNGEGKELEIIKDIFGGEFQREKLRADPIE